jgi:spermidine synthase
MIRWVQLDAGEMPGGGGALRLMQRGTEYSIMSGPIELMNSRLSGSEEALATLAQARLAGRPAPSILIGGLGMGFTLRAALAGLPPKGSIVVAEVTPKVIDWARGPLAALHAGSLDDARVSVTLGDVGVLIRQVRGAYDAILLDVDNGPEGLTRKGNDALYDRRGLAAALDALRPGGVLSVWSSAPDERFTRRLRDAGFAVEEMKVRATGKGRGARHVIWLAVKPPSR